MQRNFEFFEGEFYHVFNRGVEKREIFQESSDWKRFQQLLYLCNGSKPIIFKELQGEPLAFERGETLTDIIGYALMPNHFHFLMFEKKKGGTSKFMSKLQTAYSMYFNKKYERSGPLVCKPFRAKHIHDDTYLQWVFSYIHANPLDILDIKSKNDIEGEFEFISAYPYSSLRDYVHAPRLEGRIISPERFPTEILPSKALRDFLRVFPRTPLGKTVDNWPR